MVKANPLLEQIDNKEEPPVPCKEKTEVYSRIVGFMRPYNIIHRETNTWNKGKIEEQKDRKAFILDSSYKTV